MNVPSNTTTTTETSAPQSASVPSETAASEATAKASRKSRKAPAKAKESTADESPRDTLHNAVAQAVKDAAGKSPAESIAILRKAMELVRNAVPDVEFSSNKEQRAAQLKALREQRAAMGTQQLARVICDALAKIPGAEESRRYSARILANGGLTATETIRTAVKSPARYRGYSIR